MSFALLFTLVLMLFSVGTATAEEGSGEIPPAGVEGVIDSLTGNPEEARAPSTGTDTPPADPSVPLADPAPSEALARSEVGEVLPPSTGSAAAEPSSSADDPVDDQSTGAGTPTAPVVPRGMAEEDPCLAVIEQLVADLAVLLTEDAEVIEDALLNDPDAVADFFADLDADTAAKVEALLTEAAADFEECLPSLPSEPEPTEPRPEPIVHPAPAEPAGYENCDEVRAAGAAPIHAGQPGYAAHLDRDHDGIGCEEDIVVTQPAAHTGAGQLAYTGATVQPMLAWGAALVLSGGWLIRSARRRA